MKDNLHIWLKVQQEVHPLFKI